MNEYFLVARITSISGAEGFLNLQIITDFPQKLFILKEVYLDFFGSKKKFIVEKTRSSKKNLQIKFERFNSRRELEVLINREVFIRSEDIAELPDGSYFIHDLIGSEVWREGKVIGSIKEVLQLPANDVFVILDEKRNEILIPFVLEFIDHIDEKNKKIFLKPGYGEYEDDES